MDRARVLKKKKAVQTNITRVRSLPRYPIVEISQPILKDYKLRAIESKRTGPTLNFLESSIIDKPRKEEIYVPKKSNKPYEPRFSRRVWRPKKKAEAIEKEIELIKKPYFAETDYVRKSEAELELFIKGAQAEEQSETDSESENIPSSHSLTSLSEQARVDRLVNEAVKMRKSNQLSSPSSPTLPHISSSHLKMSIRFELQIIVAHLLTPGKGLLQFDESRAIWRKRLGAVSLPNVEKYRRKFRDLVFSTESLGQYISGAILTSDTFYRKSTSGVPYIELLKRKRILSGIKICRRPYLMDSWMEYIREGLDDFEERCSKFKQDGCHFASWLTSFEISDDTPSYEAIHENIKVLASFASICQTNRIVPIISADILPDGDHDIERSEKVTETLLAFLIKVLIDSKVYLEGVIIHMYMVTEGNDCYLKSSDEEIAECTVLSIFRRVPPAVPGIMFGTEIHTTEEEATRNLNAINRYSCKKPWILTFSFGFALLNSPMLAWKGRDDNVHFAQTELIKRAQANSAASRGLYDPN